MNGTLYQNPTFPTLDEEKIINQDINKEKLQCNKGKLVKVYLSFPNKDMDFEGRLEYIDHDYIVISNIDTNIYNLIPSRYINYISFNEKILI